MHFNLAVDQWNKKLILNGLQFSKNRKQLKNLKSHLQEWYLYNFGIYPETQKSYKFITPELAAYKVKYI